MGGQTPGQFVTKPFRSWVNKTQKINAHAAMDYHEVSMTKMQEFVMHPTHSIDSLLDNEARKQMAVNQKVIVTMLCGRQGLALRGHRDDKCFSNDADDECHNPGNFIELVRFRAQTDEILRSHLESAPKNARYTSKTIQNELINVIAKNIRQTIVNETKFFSVIADETTDISNKEELSVSLRYVLDNKVHEVFIDFMEVERITGVILAHSIIHLLTTLGLSLSDLRGQCYDGASNMAGARSGCKSVIMREAPMAIYIHCAAHRLNLAVVSACKIQAFKNVESYIGEISRVFKFSPKRQRLFDRAIDAGCASKKKLTDACRTRWIERIDSYSVFLELMPALYMTLQAMVYPSEFQHLGIDWNWMETL